MINEERLSPVDKTGPEAVDKTGEGGYCRMAAIECRQW